jgi:hypothetical protein
MIQYNLLRGCFKEVNFTSEVICLMQSKVDFFSAECNY